MAGKGGGAKIQFCVPLKSGLICWGVQSRESQLQCQYWGSFMGGVGGSGLDGWVCQTLLAKSFVCFAVCVRVCVCVCVGYITATSSK